MSPRKTRILAILAVVAGVAVFLMLMSAVTSGGSPAAAQDVPALVLKDIDGNTVSLEDFRGKVLLVNNFAVWCPPCRAEMPVLEAYYREHKEDGFAIVAVEAGQPLDQVRDFTTAMSLTFPVLSDPDLESVSAFRNNALPNSILIGKDWKIRKTWVGGIDRAYLDNVVTPLLAE